jgi:glycosyltransferase involved in cell wall biosynthesis
MDSDAEKINVMQVSNQLDIGGTEKALQIFTEYLNKNIFNVYVCGVFRGGIREKILREEGFETYIVNGNPAKFFQLLRRKKIDIVHVHRSGKSEGFVIQTAKKAGVPIIVETNVFGLYDNSETEKMIDIHLLISKTTALKYIRNARISLNEFLNKGTVLYYPVDVQKFILYKPSEKQIHQFKSELGIDENMPLICRVGRSDLGKWNEFLVDAMKHITKKIPEIKFLIVGGIPDLIKKKIQKLGLEKIL